MTRTFKSATRAGRQTASAANSQHYPVTAQDLNQEVGQYRPFLIRQLKNQVPNAHQQFL